ncbi:hypothetical protein CXF68_15820 [Tenacibaculum sp. Bg11-29]|uniref:hypothetical protein n=1 Tax=Tenacibaculum sp. Bg11-29 TaxID=2058306 RepID=UPI000C324874|nr:hypothetical protein [Tenacibaculum sp. Bg11-29]PKH52071.1 hypothetical protein CXF68_15820 [Tenacibaculum sp. Bg11-29]
MNQTFGCIIIQKENKLLFKNRISKSVSHIGLKILTKSSQVYKLEDYLVHNELKENEILTTEIEGKFLILGHSLYFLINEDYLGVVIQAKRTLFHFTQHGKSEEYGYKYYFKGNLCTHEICFGENYDFFSKNWIQDNGVKLPQSIHRENALNAFSKEKKIPLELLRLLKMSLPRKGMSSLFFHPIKQQWVYGKGMTKVNPLKITFQELAPQGHKRGKPFVIDKNSYEKGLLISWSQLFYELHHRSIKEITGFRFDYPKEFPINLIFTKYEIFSK